MVQISESFRQRLTSEQRLKGIAAGTILGKAAGLILPLSILVASTLFPNGVLCGQAPQRPVPKPLPPAGRQPSTVPRPKTAEEDLIILRDRSRRMGKLEICGMSACLIGRNVVPRSQAEWIGLTVRQLAQPVPPSPRDS